MYCIKTWKTHRYSYDFEDSETTIPTEETIVCTFDTKELAEKYLEKSKLRSPNTHMFKKNSLLRYYDSAAVEIFQNVPHNPTIED